MIFKKFYRLVNTITHLVTWKYLHFLSHAFAMILTTEEPPITFKLSNIKSAILISFTKVVVIYTTLIV